jgi:hypothetical protein
VMPSFTYCSRYGVPRRAVRKDWREIASNSIRLFVVEALARHFANVAVAIMAPSAVDGIATSAIRE